MTLRCSVRKVRREIHREEMRESMHVEITMNLATEKKTDGAL